MMVYGSTVFLLILIIQSRQWLCGRFFCVHYTGGGNEIGRGRSILKVRFAKEFHSLLIRRARKDR